MELSFSNLFVGYLDYLTGNFALGIYLLAVTDERAVLRRLKKFLPLFLFPIIEILLVIGMYSIPELRRFQYYILSFIILLMCTFWTRWAWQFGFWQALAATCMAGIFQVCESTLSRVLIWENTLDESTPFAVVMLLYLGISTAAVLLLYRLRFGRWFRLLLDSKSAVRRTAFLLFALEVVMEMLLRMVFGVKPQFLGFYYVVVAVMVIMTAMLMVYLAQRFDAARKMQAQQDVIAQQRLYEQDLEAIRREVRTFRHDYKNLLAGLAQQAGEGELEGLCHTLSELDAGFDQRLGKKIQASTQIGNLQIPEVRSLLLSKLTAMREKGVECRLEVLYPVTAVDMDVWDFVRCLGILTDNAWEAALDLEEPWVEIVLLAQEGRVFLRVSNSYTNTIEPGNMWNDGWSTKGTGRGLGLSSYQRILEGYPNTSHGTSWENGVFVQKLTVEGRL